MTARIAPVARIDDDLLARGAAAAGGPLRAEANVYRTLANHPLLFEAWLAWGGQVARAGALSPELRELVVLRTALVGRGRYPLTQHVRIAGEVGLDAATIARTAEEPATAAWPPTVAAALTAVDRLLLVGTLDEPSWLALHDTLGPGAALDLVSTVAFYRMAGWMLNACRTPLDDGQAPVDLAAGLRIGTPPPADDGPTAVRIEGIRPEEWPETLLAETAEWPRFRGRTEIRAAGVYTTLANQPELFRSLGPVMAHLLVDNRLDDRQREIAIVRGCLQDRGAYPYRQHVRIAAVSGVAEAELDELAKARPRLDDPAAAAIVDAVDELHLTDDLGDEIWARLASHLDPRAIMDLIVTVGFYGLISMALNVAATPLEPGEVDLAPRPYDKSVRSP